MRGTVLLLGLLGACARAPLVPPTAAQADDRLVQALELKLSVDQRLCGFPIEVVVKDRIVLLQGRVGSQDQRRRAEALALQAGAVRVVNRLAIQPFAADRERC
jgi:osmotically-inducible protein OsmY